MRRETAYTPVDKKKMKEEDDDDEDSADEEVQISFLKSIDLKNKFKTDNVHKAVITSVNIADATPGQERVVTTSQDGFIKSVDILSKEGGNTLQTRRSFFVSESGLTAGKPLIKNGPVPTADTFAVSSVDNNVYVFSF